MSGLSAGQEYSSLKLCIMDSGGKKFRFLELSRISQAKDTREDKVHSREKSTIPKGGPYNKQRMQQQCLLKVSQNKILIQPPLFAFLRQLVQEASSRDQGY